MNTFKKITLTSAVFFALFAFNACGDDSNSTSASGENSSLSSAVEDDESSSSINDNSSSSVIPGSSSSVILSDSEGSSSSVKGSAPADGASSSSVIPDPDRESSSSSVKSSSSSAKSSSSVNSSSSVKSSSSSSAKSSSSVASSSSYTPFIHKSQFLTDSLITDAYKVFTDPRDGQSYYYLTINGKRQDGIRGSVTIFAQNLNYGEQIDGKENQNDDTKTEKYCYDNDWTMCDRYGGLYQWAETMNLPSECNTKSCANLIQDTIDAKGFYQGICPNGWRLMTYDDYELIYWSTDKGAAALRSEGGFNGYNSTGLSLVGAGYRHSKDTTGFEGRLRVAAWYYPTEVDKNKNLSTSEEFNDSDVFPSAGYSYQSKDTRSPNTAHTDSKLWGLSVRCVKVE